MGTCFQITFSAILLEGESGSVEYPPTWAGATFMESELWDGFAGRLLKDAQEEHLLCLVMSASYLSGH